MKIELRNPTRSLEIEGAMTVTKLLNKLDVNSASVLVICDGALVPIDAFLPDDAVVEIRNVISGGTS
ncbi:MAG: sulfur carrier protein ThiS [Acidimicrobiales bacterium]|jgi:sulfur carrier protein ThiS